MKINESIEMYLETILVLQNKNKEVRSIDIATEMGFSKASVSVAIKNLKEKKFIKVDDKGFISFTDDGSNLANSIYEKHTIIAKALIKIGVPEKIAKEDACKIEHDISDMTFEKIKKYLGL